MADAACAKPFDDAAVRPVRQRHAARTQREQQREHVARPESLADQLLRGIDEAEQPAEHQRARQRISNRRPQRDRTAHIARDDGEIDALLVVLVQRFGQADIDPGGHQRAEHRHRHENPAPVAQQQQHALPDAGRDGGDQQEDHEDQAHHPRHLVAAHAVADDRRRQRDDACCKETLQRTKHDHGGEIGNQRAGQRQHDVEAQRGKQHRPAAEAVGEGPRNQRPDPGSEQIDTDDELPIVARRTQRQGEIVQCREDRIDAEGITCHQQRHHRDQLALANVLAFDSVGYRTFAAGKRFASHLHKMSGGGQGSALQPVGLSIRA